MDYYGSVCEVLNRRRANIIDNDFQDLTALYIIISELPVCESFGFYKEIMASTSGRIGPHIEFAGWKIIEEDPFFIPVTKEDVEEWGEEATFKNYAKS